MNLADVTDQLATRLDTITGLRVVPFTGSTLSPPAAVIGYPTDYTFDLAYGRGADRMTIPVVVVVGPPASRTTRRLLGDYVDGSGARSIKAVLEAGIYTAFDGVRVVSVTFDVYAESGVDYMAAVFDLDIAGAGS